MNHNAMLSTIDNPFDPCTNFEAWFLYDIQTGHNCCSVLAQVARISDRMCQEEVEREVERAIDEIVLNDETNLYVKVVGNIESNASD